MVKKSVWVTLSITGLGIVAIVIAQAAMKETSSEAGAPISKVKVVATYQHDPTAFSQGLVVEGETLYEGTGKYNDSELRSVALKTGEVQKRLKLGPNFFGEGITIFGNKIYQLTWKEHACFIFDKETMKYEKTLQYSGEGWGLTDDERRLFMSDGSSTIRVMDPETFKVIDRLSVREGRRRIENINELEFVDGEIWANIWYEDFIARIDPKSGNIKGWIDCRNVFPMNQRPDREHVLNGIAHDAETGKIYVTGKYWPKLYEIEVIGD